MSAPSLIRGFVVVMLASAIAHAEPERVLVVDPDEELVHAIEWTLQPWKMVVVAESDAIVDPALVSARAASANAQFIVWRDRDELVVFDRKRDVTERRPARTGAMDPVSAASAALTVKTMMRLPDPVPEESASNTTTTTTSVVAPAPIATEDADVVRIEASLGVDTGAALRATFGAMYRPTPYALRVGGAFELASQEVEQSGFQGRARDYSLLARASWTLTLGQFELEPWIAAGVMADVVDGKHGQEVRHETAWVPTGRVGLALWWWHPRQWGFAVTGGANFALSTPTYTRDAAMPTKAVIYDMPGVGGTIGIVAAWRR